MPIMPDCFKLIFIVVAFFFISCKEKEVSDLANNELVILAEKKKDLLDDFRKVSFNTKGINESNKFNAPDLDQTIHAYQEFTNPPEHRSHEGKLETLLRIAYADQKIYNPKLKKDINVKLRNYEGSLVGPTLRIVPGDVFRVKVTNNLPGTANTKCDPHAMMHHSHNPCDQIDPAMFNITNLHTHGLHVSPQDSSDNILLQIQPSCSFQHHYNLPENHPQGTFWYHSHVHGSTAIQVSSGMAGALIVEGGLDTIPEIKKAEEKIFVLQQIPYTKDATGQFSVENFGSSFGPRIWQGGADSLGWRTIVNGQTFPIIHLKSGEVQRWRFIHAGVRETLMLRLEKHSLHQIASDGIAFGRIDKTDAIELQPGYRSDVLIKANTVTTQDTLMLFDGESNALNGLQARSESVKIVAIIIISPEKEDMPLPTDAQLKNLAPFKPITDQEVDGQPKQNVNFNISRASDGNLCFSINGQPFNMSNPPRILVLNTASEWEITSSLANHPYHIHVNSFQIIKVIKPNGREQIFDPPLWKDTYLVKAGEKVILRSRYEDFIGMFVIHCHILDHEDQGMMELVQIVNKNPT
jgi:FtsP/CotA-like multicopper oxidase with cupredoxin domain